MFKTLRFLLVLGLALYGQAVTAADRLTVVLDRTINPNHAPLAIAAEKGFFAAQDLKVELLVPANPGDPAKLAAAGKADIALLSQPQLQIQVNQGQPLKRIGTLIATPLNALIVLEDGPIGSLAELKGHKIGYVADGAGRILLQALLAANNIEPEKVGLVEVEFPAVQALLSGQMDAAFGAFRNLDLNQLIVAGKAGRGFYPEEEGIPAYDQLVMAANRDELDDPRLKPFLRAVEQAVQFLINHPDEGWRIFAGRYPDLDTEPNQRAWPDTLTRFALRPAALDTGRYKRFAQFLAKQGAITTALPVSNYAVELEAIGSGL